MSSKVWGIVIQKHTKMNQHHVHMRSTNQFNQVGVHEKMTEMRSIVWMPIAIMSIFQTFVPQYISIVEIIDD